MTPEDALAAVAVVDRLRLEAARAAVALEGLEAAMLDRGAAMVTVGKVLGLPQPVRRWCSEQAAILATGTEQQQAIFRELVTSETGQSSGGCTTGDGHDRPLAGLI